MAGADLNLASQLAAGTHALDLKHSGQNCLAVKSLCGFINCLLINFLLEKNSNILKSTESKGFPTGCQSGTNAMGGS